MEIGSLLKLIRGRLFEINFASQPYLKGKYYNYTVGKRGGQVVERRTTEQEVGGSILTLVAVLCP